MGIHINGLFALLVLIADIWAIVNLIQSHETTGKKVLWIVCIMILPVIGVIIWFFAGPRSGETAGNL